MLAQEEARRLGHGEVDSIHILLGLIGSGSTASMILRTSGVNLTQARVVAATNIPPRKDRIPIEIPFTPDAKRLLEGSWDAARRDAVNYIGTEHLLLAMIQLPADPAFAMLGELGVDTDAITHSLAYFRVENVLPADRSLWDRFAILVGLKQEPPEIPLSNAAVSVIDTAKALAASYSRGHAGTEHILLSITQSEHTTVSTLLKSVGVDSRTVESKIAGLVPPYVDVAGTTVVLTPRATRVVSRASELAKELCSPCTEPEHLLLSLLEEDHGFALLILHNLQISTRDLQQRLSEALRYPA